MTQGRNDGRTRRWLEHVGELPTDPGVYLMRDHQGQVIYVGKAKNLRARVRSYFTKGSSDYRAFVQLLGDVLGDLETIVTRSEKEALLLERELISRHMPRFNVIWRDDKQYLCLRIDPTHRFPRVEVVRQMAKDGARYFGPFHSASAARQTLRVLNRHFQLRTCSDAALQNRARACLEHQIGRCPAPCVLEVEPATYGASVDDAILFLEGKRTELVARLSARMWEAAARQAYEVAARLRDQAAAVKKTLERQDIALPTLRDQDVFGIYREGLDLCIAVLEVRGGRVAGVHTHLFSDQAATDGAVVEAFLLQSYATREDVPAEIIVPLDLESRVALSELMSERRGMKVEVIRPQRGERARVLELAQENAAHAFSEKRQKSGANLAVLEGLKAKLLLTRLPVRIECYDISNLQGRMIVGARVVFEEGVPAKAKYRRYRIRSKETQDDFAAMYEVLLRRLRRGQEEGDLPDLVVIDGGKGQLNAAGAAFRDLGVTGVDLIALAKSRRLDAEEVEEAAPIETQRSPERVFLPGAKDPVVLKQSSKEVFLLARVRDEAHRFAITFHRQLRSRSAFQSALEDIPGVGPRRRRALLEQLGSLARIKEATIAELEAVPGVGRAAAQKIWSFLHGEQGSAPGGPEPTR